MKRTSHFIPTRERIGVREDAREKGAHQLLVSAPSWTAEAAFVKIAVHRTPQTPAHFRLHQPLQVLTGKCMAKRMNCPRKGTLSTWVLSRLPGCSVVLVTLLLYVIINSLGRRDF